MTGMRNWLGSILCLVAMLAAIPGAAAAQTWKKHSFPADGFEVDFSGAIDGGREDLTMQSSGQILNEARFTQNLQTGGYSVWVTTLAEPNPNWEEAANAAFAAIGCAKLVDNRVVEVSGTRVLHMSGVGCVKGVLSVTGRFAHVGNRIYQLIAIFPPTGPETEDARRFIESFTLIQGKPRKE